MLQLADVLNLKIDGILMNIKNFIKDWCNQPLLIWVSMTLNIGFELLQMHEYIEDLFSVKTFNGLILHSRFLPS